MPTRIRLQRKGKKGKPVYHVVIADGRAPRDGKFIERIGIYNPVSKPAEIDINFDRALYWLQSGAEPSDTVNALLSFKGVLYKHHLLKGVKKGAMTEEMAEAKFQAWLQEKQEKHITKIKEAELSGKDSRKKRMEAEMKVNETRAKELQEKRAKELKALHAEEAAEETEVEAVAETSEEPVAEAQPVAEEQAAPVEEAKAEVETTVEEEEAPVKEAEAEVETTVEEEEAPVEDAKAEAEATVEEAPATTEEAVAEATAPEEPGEEKESPEPETPASEEDTETKA